MPLVTCLCSCLFASLFALVRGQRGRDVPAAMSPTTFDDASYRFSPISPHDHAGYVWIATILGLIYSGLSGLARARIKWGVHGAEDYLLGLATVRAVAARLVHTSRLALMGYQQYRLCSWDSPRP